RAQQMNQGAAIAQGESLLFLHGDTQLPQQFPSLVLQTLAQPGTVAGAFELHIQGEGAALRAVEWGVQQRSRHLGLPYGDQGLFLRRELFEQVGGFADLPILEDLELVRRLQRRGRVAIAPRRRGHLRATLEASGRWQNHVDQSTGAIGLWCGHCPSAPGPLVSQSGMSRLPIARRLLAVSWAYGFPCWAF
ncbi:MAG: hypothetical protein HC824_05775, partial [Synechococcales cyanobacterium RM1_1_8]|nr:hypothetical protein [Synechococcales cyanobacterium RM1_1_8]